ncbi:MAG: hypothetical protein Q9169_006512 [Polycauliona sp. 2 TL-2023]
MASPETAEAKSNAESERQKLNALVDLNILLAEQRQRIEVFRYTAKQIKVPTSRTNAYRDRESSREIRGMSVHVAGGTRRSSIGLLGSMVFQVRGEERATRA